jgi:hypothetical protein
MRVNWSVLNKLQHSSKVTIYCYYTLTQYVTVNLLNQILNIILWQTINKNLSVYDKSIA